MDSRRLDPRLGELRFGISTVGKRGGLDSGIRLEAENDPGRDRFLQDVTASFGDCTQVGIALWRRDKDRACVYLGRSAPLRGASWVDDRALT